MTDPTSAPKYATMRDYDVAHLLGGPDSSRLEFDSDYYRHEFDSLGPTPLVEFLREHPSAMRHRAVQLAAYAGMDFFNRQNHEVSPSGVERRYRDAGEFAVAGYIASDSAPDFTVDQLPFPGHLTIPEAELREVARLALQRFRVYEIVVQTGEVPEL